MIKTLVVTTMNHFADDDITMYINETLKDNRITQENLIDIKFSCDNSHVNVLVIYKETEEG